MAIDPQDKSAVPLAEEELPSASPRTSTEPEAQHTHCKDQKKQSSSFKWPSLNPLRLQTAPPVPKQRAVSRENDASIPSRILFQWMAPFMKVGYLRDLEIQDIWTVSPDRSVGALSDKLGANMKRRQDQGSKKPLFWAICDTFKREVLAAGICQIISGATVILSPLVIKHLIAYATLAYNSHHNSNQPGPNVGEGMGYALALFFMQLIRSVSASQAFYNGSMVGAQLKAVLVSRIFSKAMRLSNRARSGDGDGGCGWNNGRITMLMGVDSDRLDRACETIHLLVAAVTSLILALVVLLVNIGYSSLAGYAFLVVGLTLLAKVVHYLVELRARVNRATDQRVTLTLGILHSVRFVKFFGWETFFLERLQVLRSREIGAIRKLLAVRHAVISSFVSLSTFAAMLSFITYSLSGHGFTADSIFSSFAAFNAIRGPLSMLNMVLSATADAWTALQRLEAFFMAEEREDFIEWDRDMENAIEIKDASFTWEQMPTLDKKEVVDDNTDSKAEHKSSELKEKASAESTSVTQDSGEEEQRPFTLTDIDLDIGRSELIAVIGTVGSGKSSLLGALAGEMRLTAGSVCMGATRAFCPQYAWIQNTSVRNNILFGQEYDEIRYNQVIDACSLRADLAIFPDGDQTEVGERGITVSGGQRQRLNIARAIYSKSEIILMDDPLSAVDAHVGRHIMDEAICGLLKHRCRVLATHQLHVLGRCDRIVVMDKGHIQAVDTFENLMRGNEVFQGLMANTSQLHCSEAPGDNDDNDDDDDDDDDAIEKPEAAAIPTRLDGENKGSAALMQQEERATDSVGWDVWKAYIRASGSFFNLFAFLGLTTIMNGVFVMVGLWLSFWTSQKFPNLGTGGYMGIYAAICFMQFIIVYVYSLQITTATANASKRMFHHAMYRTLRAPMSFFDTTPIGRITNRFSKDVQVMDSDLGDVLRMFMLMFSQIISTMALIVAFFYYFAIAVVPLLAMLYVITGYYRGSARSLKRHEAILRSGVFARFGEAITGITCIQAYNREDHFRHIIHEAIDSMNGAYFLTSANVGWLSIRVEFVGSLVILVTAILVVTSRFNVAPSVAGLVVSYILSITTNFQFCVRELADVENNMNSTERIYHYGSSLEEEAPATLGEVPPNWPEKGRITFTDAQMRYRSGMPLVLKGLTMDVQGGERIGIVGRTGAGKSSIMTALFRMTELSGGSIKIDDIDISTIGLHDLRTRLTIIPQDPTLFQGTIRSNLDPFDEHTDLDLWSALRKAHLVGQDLPPTEPKQPSSHRLNLDTAVDQDGLNFSLGQRQLMALARALVRDSRIIVCDEATSSVDFETDQRVQETMAHGFRGKTLLCIAHRLRTIIQYDRICVMDQGGIAEMDTPLRLWDLGGIFRGMCEQSGLLRGDLE